MKPVRVFNHITEIYYQLFFEENGFTSMSETTGEIEWLAGDEYEDMGTFNQALYEASYEAWWVWKDSQKNDAKKSEPKSKAQVDEPATPRNHTGTYRGFADGEPTLSSAIEPRNGRR